MVETLAEFTDKPAYRYRAFELLVTLDLDIYKAIRRIIVPADIEFQKLHNVMQRIFNWKNYHLYDFTVLNNKSQKPYTRLIPDEEGLDFDNSAVLLYGHKISEYFPQRKTIIYTYDMGDYWEHKIEFVRVLDPYDQKSPYLLEASGQAPPEDVGGVGEFIDFREIMLDPDHPAYDKTKKWARYWSPEL